MKKTALLLSAVMAVVCLFLSCGSDEDVGISVAGRWQVTEDRLKEYSEEKGTVFTSGIVEFSEEGTWSLVTEADFSDSLCITDEGVYVSGKLNDDNTYDGKKLTFGKNDLVFERIDGNDKDSMYGRYKCTIPGNDYIYDLRSSGESYIIDTETGKYEFDADAMTLRLDDDIMKVELEGDTLKLIGGTVTNEYIRIE